MPLFDKISISPVLTKKISLLGSSASNKIPSLRILYEVKDSLSFFIDSKDRLENKDMDRMYFILSKFSKISSVLMFNESFMSLIDNSPIVVGPSE